MVICNLKTLPVYGGYGGECLLLVGATGAGKTMYILNLIMPAAAKPFGKMVGNGSSTLRPKIIVLSNDPQFDYKISLFARLDTQPLSRFDFDEVIVEVLVALCVDASKENVKRPKVAKDLLSEKFIDGENHIAILQLLKDSGIAWINETAKIIDEISRNDMRELHQLAKTRMEEPQSEPLDTKYASSKSSIEIKLAEVLREYLEGAFLLSNGKEIGTKLAVQYNAINQQLASIAHEYFENGYQTEDGYLSLDFPLDESDSGLQQKKDAFFNNNNSGKISVEVLFKDIVIYVPINKAIASRLGTHANQYLNRNGHFEVGIIDTMGAFHRFGDKAENKEYFNRLLRSYDFEGIIWLAPLEETANEKKFLPLSSEFLRSVPFDINVFILSNKLDLAVKQFEALWNRDNTVYDPFEQDTIHVTPPRDYIRKKLIESMDSIRTELIENVSENGNGRVKILGHKATSFSPINFDNYEVSDINKLSETLITMFESFASAKEPSDKIPVKINPEYGSDIGIKLMDNLIKDGLENIIHSSLYANIANNCQENSWKTPHGNSFNALPDRLSYGEGYKVELHERFKYVQSFKITFPGSIRNSLNSIELELSRLLRQCISIQGIINKDSELEERLLTKLLSHFSTRKVTAALVYHKTFRPVMNEAYFSFGTKFRAYIKNIDTHLTNKDDVTYYVDAIQAEILRSFKALLDNDVIYKTSKI